VRREPTDGLLNEARPDRRNVGLGIAKRALRCMDRVVPEDVIVLVWSGRAENELGIGQRFEFHRLARRLAKDWDNLNRKALAFLRLASIRLMLRKLCSPAPDRLLEQ
jgi:hypothetical protein